MTRKLVTLEVSDLLPECYDRCNSITYLSRFDENGERIVLDALYLSYTVEEVFDDATIALSLIEDQFLDESDAAKKSRVEFYNNADYDFSNNKILFELVISDEQDDDGTTLDFIEHDIDEDLFAASFEDPFVYTRSFVSNQSVKELYENDTWAVNFFFSIIEDQLLV